MADNLGRAIVEIMFQVTGTRASRQEVATFLNGMQQSLSGVNSAATTMAAGLNQVGRNTTRGLKESASAARELGSATRSAADDFGKLIKAEQSRQKVSERSFNKNLGRQQSAAAREQAAQVAKSREPFLQLIADGERAARQNSKNIQRVTREGIRLARQRQTAMRNFGNTVRKEADGALREFANTSNQIISNGISLARRSSANVADFAKGANRGLREFNRNQEAFTSRLNSQITNFQNSGGFFNQRFGNIQKATQDVDFFNTRTFRMSQNLREVGFAISDVGRQFVFFGAALIGSLVPLISENSKFEQSVKNVVAVIGELDSVASRGLAVQSLSDTFIDIGERTEFTADQIANAARELALAGFGFSEIGNSIEDVVNLASAGNISLEKAALIAANVGRAFQISTSNFGRITDVLTAVATNSNTTVETLGESFKLLAPIASSLGQPLEEVTAALGLLGSAGVRGSRSGTGLSRAFSELLEKSDEFDSKLREIGLSFEDIDPEKVGLTEIIAVFERLQRIQGTSVIFELFDQRSARVISTLINQGSQQLDELEQKARDSAGIAARIRRERLDTLEGDIRITFSALQSSLIQLGETINEPIRNLLSSVISTIRSVRQFAEANPALTSSLLQVVAVMGTFVLTVGGLALSIGAVTRAASVLNLAMAALNIRMVQSTVITRGVALAFGTAVPAAFSLSRAVAILRTAFTALVKFTAVGVIITGVVVAVTALTTAIVRVSQAAEKSRLSKLSSDLDRFNEATEKAIIRNRQLANSLDLFVKLPTLNTLQTNELFGDENGVFGTDFDKEISEAKKQFFEVNQLFEQSREQRSRFRQGIGAGVTGRRRVSQTFDIILNDVENFSKGFSLIKRDIDAVTTRSGGGLIGGTKERSFQRTETVISDSEVDTEVGRELLARQKLQISQISRLEQTRDVFERFAKAFSNGKSSIRKEIVELDKLIAQSTAEIDRLEFVDRNEQQEKSFKLEQQVLKSLKDQRSQLSVNLKEDARRLEITKELTKLSGRFSEINESNLSEESKSSARKALTAELDQQISKFSEINSLIKEENRLKEEGVKASEKLSDILDNITEQNRKNSLSQRDAALDDLQQARKQARDLRDQEVVQQQLNLRDARVRRLESQDALDNLNPSDADFSAKRIRLKNALETATDDEKNAAQELVRLADLRLEISEKFAEAIGIEDAKFKDEQLKKQSESFKEVLRVREDVAKQIGDIDKEVAAFRERSLIEIDEKTSRIAIENQKEFKEGQLELLKLEVEKRKESFETAKQKEQQDAAEKRRQELEKSKEKKEQQSLDRQKKITDFLLQQANSIRDVAKVTQFLNRLDKGRVRQADKARRDSLVAARQLRGLVESGAEESRIDSLRSRLGSTIQFAREAGVGDLALQPQIDLLNRPNVSRQQQNTPNLPANGNVNSNNKSVVIENINITEADDPQNVREVIEETFRDLFRVN